MTYETVTLCVAVVAFAGLVIWSTQKRWIAEDERDEARRERDTARGEADAARVCRDAARRERDKASAACEALRTAARADIANGALLARLVIEQVGREHIEPAAGVVSRDKVTSLTDWGRRP